MPLFSLFIPQEITVSLLSCCPSASHRSWCCHGDDFITLMLRFLLLNIIFNSAAGVTDAQRPPAELGYYLSVYLEIYLQICDGSVNSTRQLK